MDVALRALLDSGLLDTEETQVSALQTEYAAYVGRGHCRATGSGTAAVHCALVAAGVGPGHEVIVPALGFSAFGLAVLHAGATPVFVDVDERTFNMDPARIAEAITERTAAILAVHLHGLPADMPALSAIAEEHRIPIVEDGAQAHGAKSHGRIVGTFGQTAGFSTQETKIVNGQVGGLFVCDKADEFLAADRLAHYGEDSTLVGPGETRSYWSGSLGFNYRMHPVGAAFARMSLRELDCHNRTARRNAAILSAGLSEIRGVTPPYTPADIERGYWGYRAVTDPSVYGWDGDPTEYTERVIVTLQAEGVAADTYQLSALPEHYAFRLSPRAWTPQTPDVPPRPWHPERYPATINVLNQSFVLAPRDYPLWLQTTSLMHAYVEALHKVVNRIDFVLGAPIERLRPVPPLPPRRL